MHLGRWEERGAETKAQGSFSVWRGKNHLYLPASRGYPGGPSTRTAAPALGLAASSPEAVGSRRSKDVPRKQPGDRPVQPHQPRCCEAKNRQGSRCTAHLTPAGWRRIPGASPHRPRAASPTEPGRSACSAGHTPSHPPQPPGQTHILLDAATRQGSHHPHSRDRTTKA